MTQKESTAISNMLQQYDSSTCNCGKDDQTSQNESEKFEETNGLRNCKFPVQLDE